MIGITRRLVIRGRVQGVGYRDWAKATAAALEIRGWVRNRRDLSVEILCFGPADRIDRFTELCRDGPIMALVTDIAVLAGEDDGASGFEVRSTL